MELVSLTVNCSGLYKSQPGIYTDFFLILQCVFIVIPAAQRILNDIFWKHMLCISKQKLLATVQQYRDLH